jgi:hypothetical protein
MGKLASISFGIVFAATVVSWILALAGNGELLLHPRPTATELPVLAIVPGNCQLYLAIQNLNLSTYYAFDCCFALPGALNAVCLDACRYYFGLSWWTIWFEFFILLATIPVGVSVQRPLACA